MQFIVMLLIFVWKGLYAYKIRTKISVTNDTLGKHLKTTFSQWDPWILEQAVYMIHLTPSQKTSDTTGLNMVSLPEVIISSKICKTNKKKTQPPPTILCKKAQLLQNALLKYLKPQINLASFHTPSIQDLHKPPGIYVQIAGVIYYSLN